MALLLPAFAGAQLHEAKFGRYTIRATLAPSTAIPVKDIDRYAIAPSADRVVLTVLVLDELANVAPKSVPATVNVRIRNAGKSFHSIDMRATVQNGGIAYVGAIPVPHERSTTRFIISARPPNWVPLTIMFRDSLRHSG